MIRRLSPDEFTQGTLFSCAFAQDYLDKDVLGLVITARCDTAQGKANIINYLPVVKLADWILCDGVLLTAKRAFSSAEAGMRQAIRDLGLAESIVDTLPTEDTRMIVEEASNGKNRKIAERFAYNEQARDEARHFRLTQSDCREEKQKFLQLNIKIYNSIVEELAKNQIADFHYLDRSQENEECEGYVVLLREVRFVSTILSTHIKDGIDLEKYRSIEPSNDVYTGLTLNSPDHFSMPISCVESPYIEFLMQRFSNLFSRIGVRDIPKEQISRIQSALFENERR